MKKSKAQLRKEREAKQQNERSVATLRNSINTMQLFGSVVVPSDRCAQMPTNTRYEMDSTKTISSNTSTTVPANVRAKLSPEMEERERIAQVEAKRKAKRVAPLFNKGAYQFITDDTDPKTIGRK
jgi:hypothetical protein